MSFVSNILRIVCTLQNRGFPEYYACPMAGSPILSLPVEAVALMKVCWFGDTLLSERLALMRAAIEEAVVLVFMESLWRVHAEAVLLGL